MNRMFKHKDAAPTDPIIFETILSEKPGGGLVKNPEFDLKPGIAMSQDTDGLFIPIKGYRLITEVKNVDTTIKIAKGSGIKKGDVIAHGKVGVACTEVDTTKSDDYDIVTVTMGVAIAQDTVLYQAAEAADGSEKVAAPIHKPEYILGNFMGNLGKAGEGDFEARLIRAASLRKETAPVAQEVVDLMKGITLD